MMAAILLVILAALFLLTRSKKSKQAPSGWRILYSTGFPDAPTPQGDGAIGPEFWRGD